MADDTSCGVILLPHNTEAGCWGDYARSAALRVELSAGCHQFSLCYTPRCANTNGSTNQCMVRQLEITRLA